jgi:hypothetical protein
MNYNNFNKIKSEIYKNKKETESETDNFLRAHKIYQEKLNKYFFEYKWNLFVNKSLSKLYKFSIDNSFKIYIAMILKDEQQYEFMKKSVNTFNFNLIDVNYLKYQKNYKESLDYPYPDGHPTALGHKIIANEILSILEKDDIFK